MKITFCTLLTIVALSLTAVAAPTLTVKITLDERHDAGDKTLARPVFVIESGKQATIQSGGFEYVVTPTLLADGIVDVDAALNERNGENVQQLLSLRAKSKLGQVAKIQTDQFSFETSTTLSK